MKAREKAEDVKNFEASGLSTALQVVGVVWVLAGFFAGLSLWPESSYRSEPAPIQYALPIGLMASGLIWLIVFLGFAGILARLDMLIWLSARPQDRIQIFKLQDDWESKKIPSQADEDNKGT